MNCDVQGCSEVVTDEAMRLHRIIVNLDTPRAAAWRDLYGEAKAPCGGHIIKGLSYMNATVMSGGANGSDTPVSYATGAAETTEVSEEA